MDGEGEEVEGAEGEVDEVEWVNYTSRPEKEAPGGGTECEVQGCSRLWSEVYVV